METFSEIAPDVYQVRLPLPFALNIVNCYLLRDGGGWTIVDTGLNIPPARAAWRATFEALGIAPGDINRIIVTHSHPDHYGLAGWLLEFCRDGDAALDGPPVLMSPREIEIARRVWADAENLQARMIEFFEICGLPSETATPLASETVKVRGLTLPQPPTLQRLDAGATLQIGERRFAILHAPGHSDGQIIFYDPVERLLLCGDQVLIKITPNISLWPGGDPNPLAQFLDSLRRLSVLQVRLALPGHGPPITDWQGRLAELEAHHALRLENALAAVNGQTSVHQVSRQIFDAAELSVHEIRFALAETLAHLEYLVEEGLLRRQERGGWWYHHP